MSKSIRLIGVLLLTLASMFIAFQGLNFNEMWVGIQSANLWYFGIVFLGYLGTHCIRTLRLWLLIGFAFILTAMVWSMVADTLTHGSRSITPMRVPLMIPQLPWLFGWVFFVFTGMLITLVSLQRLWRRDRDGVQALIGVKSIDEQIEDESV